MYIGNVKYKNFFNKYIQVKNVLHKIVHTYINVIWHYFSKTTNIL